MNKEKNTAVVLAAGVGKRMGGNVAKQYMLLRDKPVLWYALHAFEKANRIDEVILVVGKGEIPFATKEFVEKYGFTKITKVIEGGAERYLSVWEALKGMDRTQDGYVFIHDGARPLISDEVICRVADALKTNCAVTCAVPLKDTVKKVDRNGVVIETPIREELVAVQTPQGVDVKKYKEALDKADDLSVFTDDMSVMEWAGYSVATAKGDYKNIKITTPEDIIIASALLESEEEE